MGYQTFEASASKSSARYPAARHLQEELQDCILHQVPSVLYSSVCDYSKRKADLAHKTSNLLDPLGNSPFCFFFQFRSFHSTCKAPGRHLPNFWSQYWQPLDVASSCRVPGDGGEGGNWLAKAASLLRFCNLSFYRLFFLMSETKHDVWRFHTCTFFVNYNPSYLGSTNQTTNHDSAF